MRTTKKVVALILLGLLVACAIGATVTYPARPQGGGPITRTVVWNLGADDMATEQTLASDPVHGHVQRIVIEATGTDTSWSVQLKDGYGVSLFSKANLSTALDPYSWAISTPDMLGTSFLGAPAHGELTLVTTDCEDLTGMVVTVYYLGNGE